MATKKTEQKEYRVSIKFDASLGVCVPIKADSFVAAFNAAQYLDVSDLFKPNVDVEDSWADEFEITGISS